MSGVSVLTLVRDREPHLLQLVEGLKRSRHPPDELIVVDMGDGPAPPIAADFPVRRDRLPAADLPLAAARNRAAALARHDALIFLDVDCIPMAGCIGLLRDAIDASDALACADIRYLGRGDAREAWTEAALLRSGQPHPARPFPQRGVRREADPGLFWSLAFAVRRSTFARIGGFDEAFVGYGGEDTDLGFRAAAAGLPLLFVGGAVACHQHHPTHDPPVQHVAAIVANARRFHARWRRWPMEGWLSAFAEMGLIAWDDAAIALRRLPTRRERAATLVSGEPSEVGDRLPPPPVVAA